MLELEDLDGARCRRGSGWRRTTARTEGRGRTAAVRYRLFRHVTRVHSGDGRDVMTRPLGPTKRNSSLASPATVHPFECSRRWWCSQRSARLSRSVRPPGFHGCDVVRVDEDRVGTSGEATMSVSAPELAALGGGRISAGPSLVHRVAHVVVEGHHHGGVTGQAPHDHRRRSGRGARARRPARSPRRKRRRAARGPPRRSGWDSGRQVATSAGLRDVRRQRTSATRASARRWSQRVSPSEGIWRAVASSPARTSA